MPDWSREVLKYNPDNPLAPNTGDESGNYLRGGPMGVISWGSLDTDVGALGYAKAASYGSNHVASLARFTAADAAGLYALGAGSKVLSGAAAAEPCFFFPVAAGFAPIPPGQVWRVGAIFFTNGVAVPAGGTDFEAGFYPVTTSGSGSMVYTLSNTDKIVETYTAGIVASALLGVPTPDRRLDFNANGDEVYALGCKISTALPAGCIVDVAVSLQLASA